MFPVQNSKVNMNLATVKPCTNPNTWVRKMDRFYLRRKSMSLLNKNKWNEEIWYAIAEDLEPAFLNKLRKEAKAGEELKFDRQ